MDFNYFQTLYVNIVFVLHVSYHLLQIAFMKHFKTSTELSECVRWDINPFESHLHQEPTYQKLGSGANGSKTRSAINRLETVV